MPKDKADIVSLFKQLAAAMKKSEEMADRVADIEKRLYAELVLNQQEMLINRDEMILFLLAMIDGSASHDVFEALCKPPSREARAVIEKTHGPGYIDDNLASHLAIRATIEDARRQIVKVQFPKLGDIVVEASGMAKT